MSSALNEPDYECKGMQMILLDSKNSVVDISYAHKDVMYFNFDSIKTSDKRLKTGKYYLMIEISNEYDLEKYKCNLGFKSDNNVVEIKEMDLKDY